jgi:zinc finger HIT domain-containing protein 1
VFALFGSTHLPPPPRTPAMGKDDQRALRTRKVSQRMAVVDDASRKQVRPAAAAAAPPPAARSPAPSRSAVLPQAAAARLDALEADNAAADAFAAHSDDEEFVVRSDSEGEGAGGGGGKGGKKRRKSKVDGGMRRTRGMVADKTRGPRAFRDFLDEAESGGGAGAAAAARYAAAAVGPPAARAPRAFCSVCGDAAAYTCARCGARYCAARCFVTHTDTRCLKFTS